MAACGSLQHIFDNPLDHPSPAFSSCKHNNITTMKLFDDSPINVFSGFDHNEKANMILTLDHKPETLSDSLGFEKLDDVDDFNHVLEKRHENVIKHAKAKITGKPKRCRINYGKDIPPPISSIGRHACFKSYRCNGRLVIKEEKIPTQEILRAYREDGRLKLRIIRFDEDAVKEGKIR